MEEIEEEAVKDGIKEKIDAHLATIKTLTGLPGFTWNYKDQGEGDLYRRRKFPKYLLAREASDYPCYVYQSELSKAFNSVSHINIKVDISEYREELLEDQNASEALFVAFTESLVTSSKETIKNVLREIYKRYQITITPNSDRYALILKVNGYKEFFKGNQQLLAYERVRICLRKKKDLHLILTEIPKVHSDKYFPPIFKMGENENFQDQWSKIQNGSPYFWYMPHSQKTLKE